MLLLELRTLSQPQRPALVGDDERILGQTYG